MRRICPLLVQTQRTDTRGRLDRKTSRGLSVGIKSRRTGRVRSPRPQPFPGKRKEAEAGERREENT